MKINKKITIGIAVTILFVAILTYTLFPYFISSKEIPSSVTGVRREMYEWARTDPGMNLLKQIPCYCGCKYENHKNAYNCFWKDNGDYDEHSSTCSVCLDIATKTKKMFEEGKDICTIRKEIDEFYKGNKDLATDTPIPEGCA